MVNYKHLSLSRYIVWLVRRLRSRPNSTHQPHLFFLNPPIKPRKLSYFSPDPKWRPFRISLILPAPLVSTPNLLLRLPFYPDPSSTSAVWMQSSHLLSFPFVIINNLDLPFCKSLYPSMLVFCLSILCFSLWGFTKNDLFSWNRSSNLKVVNFENEHTQRTFYI